MTKRKLLFLILLFLGYTLLVWVLAGLFFSDSFVVVGLILTVCGLTLLLVYILRVPQLVKISPSDEMQNLVRLALPGVTLRHAPAPPSAISFKLDNQYFSLNQSGRLWDKITQSRNISLHVPSEIADAKVELLVVLQ
jgi:hypothetical protein